MTIVLRSASVRSVQATGVPHILGARPSAAPIVADLFRHRSIGRLQALGLALLSVVVTPTPLRLVLARPT
ncbi:hypothetical protein ASF41_05710 [Methylobacterium sp. Leaf111]|nr:hypothetical protein ASF41_05710 [Methylobacterium sp. Leaf111]